MHRTNEILKTTSSSDWFYVPGELNPADDCTRPTSLKDLTNSRWLQGPSFMKPHNIESYLVDITANKQNESSDDTEFSDEITENAITVKQKKHLIIKWNHYSSWVKLIRHVAWLIKFISFWHNKKKGVHKHDMTILTSDDIKRAETMIYRIAQKESFPTEYYELSNKSSISTKSSLISLKPIFIDDLIRVGGRIKHAEIPFDSEHQIILSPSHELSRILVYYYHITNFHCGKNHTLSLLREKFWIPSCKRLIQSILQNCPYCKRMKANHQSRRWLIF